VNGVPATRVVRTLLLALHLTVSVGWVGAVCAYLVLAFAIRSTDDPDTVRAAWTGMELIGWYALAPMAVLSLLSGVVLALSTRWGLFRHYWVLVSFLGTTVLTVVLLLHLPDVSAAAEAVRTSPDGAPAARGSDLAHALGGLVLLLGILVLNIVKPAGLTRYGWRRQRASAPARTTG
jgi:hypothetical protein